jgi:hypothetical protein
MTRAALIAAIVALAAGCGGGGPAGECDGAPGLHVRVVLDSEPCLLISPDGANWTISASTGGPVLDNTTAASITDSSSPARHIDYVWPWPAGAVDGFEGQITWYGDGDGATVGHASTT